MTSSAARTGCSRSSRSRNGRPDRDVVEPFDVLPEPPVIVATQLESARALLGDGLAWEAGQRAVRAARRGARGTARRRVPRRRPRRRGLRRARDRRRRIARTGRPCARAGRHAAEAGGAPRRRALPPRAPARPRLPAMARACRVAAYRVPRRAGRVPSTCPAPPGATGPRSTAAAGSSSPATSWPHPASVRRSRSTARCRRRDWPRSPFGMHRPRVEGRTTFIEREPRAFTMRTGVWRSSIGIRPGCPGATMSQPTPDPTRWFTDLMKSRAPAVAEPTSPTPRRRWPPPRRRGPRPSPTSRRCSWTPCSRWRRPGRPPCPASTPAAEPIKDRRFAGRGVDQGPALRGGRQDLPGADRARCARRWTPPRSTSAARRSGASRCARSPTR